MTHTALDKCRDRINARLTELLRDYPASNQHLLTAMQYSLTNGGKRIRPWLIDTVGHMLGATQTDTDAAGIAIECIHTYSLIHDDLPAMDNDDLRRGKPTCHKMFDEATAILAGDALQSLAFEVIACFPLSYHGDRQRIKLIEIIARAAGLQGMCAGQSIDLESTGKSIDLAQLTELHQLKTGAILQACVQLACALSADVSEQEHAALDTYAQKIGLAFQVQDDILDVVSDSQTLGKPQGSDIDQNKNTFVSLLGLAAAKDYLTQLRQEALQALTSLPYNTQPLVELTDFIVDRKH